MQNDFWLLQSVLKDSPWLRTFPKKKTKNNKNIKSILIILLFIKNFQSAEWYFGIADDYTRDK